MSGAEAQAAVGREWAGRVEEEGPTGGGGMGDWVEEEWAEPVEEEWADRNFPIPATNEAGRGWVGQARAGRDSQDLPTAAGTRGACGEPRGIAAWNRPGMLWDDKSMVKNLKLSSDQQTHMDAIFEQNRVTLLAHFQAVQQAEAQMEELSEIARSR